MKNLRGQGSLGGGGWSGRGGGFCPNSLCLCSFLVPEKHHVRTCLLRRGSFVTLPLSRFLGRGCDEALFSEKKGFSVTRGEAIQ